MPYQEVQEAWVIIGANGRLWDSHGYPTREAAEKTAAACITGAYQIRKAKRVTHIRPATTTTGKIVGEWVIED